MKNDKTMKKLFVGEVVSDKMDKTVVVEVSRTFKHPLFGKVLKKIKKYKVNYANSDAKVGDIIEFFEGRPVAKSKYMYLKSVITKKTV